ncbi:MAG: hypothetical protein V1725_01730 [archaeon]
MKIKLLQIRNDETYNEITIEKSALFLDHLQAFIHNVGLGKPSSAYEVDGKKYDRNTYYTLFYEDHKDDFALKRSSIKEFSDGQTVRYHNRHLELLIIFLQKKIKIIFHCDPKTRRKIIAALQQFVDL